MIPGGLRRSGEVSLREITADNVLAVCALSETLTEQQRYFVADNAVSIAQAHYYPHAWLRAVYAGDELVGFVFLADNTDKELYIVSRLMIARGHHGKGYGRAALEQVVGYVRSRPGARELLARCYLGDGSPEEFYLRLGFSHARNVGDNEVELTYKL